MTNQDATDGDRLFDEARRALDAGETEDAIQRFEALLSSDDSNADAWFNLGLAHKQRRDWRQSARCNRRAAELDPSMHEAYWNLGIASTALHDWSTARWAWRGIEVDVEPGDDPPVLSLGPSPIRLTTGEVVWAERIDPCRALIANVPLPESGHRWHDLVLHDVVPNGERRAWGKTWSVFDELLRMEPGEFHTLECEVTAPAETDATALRDAFADEAVAAEDWTASVRRLCRACSLASPHEHTEGGVTPVWLPLRRYGFAGPEAAILDRLNAWAAGGIGRSFGPLLGATPVSRSTNRGGPP